MAYDDSELRRRLHRAAEVIVVPDRPLRRGARPLPMLLAAAATVAVIVLAVVAGQYLGGRRDGSIVGASPTITPSVTPAASTSPSTTGSPTPAATTGVDPTVAQHLHPLVSAWRPGTTSVIVDERKRSGNAPLVFTVIAAPSNGDAVVPLIRIEGTGGYAMRRDGSALAATVSTGRTGASRLALWETYTGALRWVTADTDEAISSPVWSPDGSFIYYGKYKEGTGDLGLFRIRPDGTGETRLIEPTSERGQLTAAITVPLFATADSLLVWGTAYEGASVDVLELATGRRASFGLVANAVSRPAQPRFLVAAGGGTGAFHSLTMWNDATGARTRVAGDELESLGHDWATDGAHFVVAGRTDPGQAFALMTSGDVGGLTRIDGTDGAAWPLWLRAGIAYLYAPTRQDGMPGPATELRIVVPGGAPKTLYRTADGNILFQRGFVAP